MDRQMVSEWTLSRARQTLRASQAKTLAWIVGGMIRVSQCILAEIAKQSQPTTTLKHRFKRLSRFLGNDRVDPVTAYTPFLKPLLKGKKRLVLALDWTHFRSLHTLALVAVIGGRGVPILWKTFGEHGLFKSQSRIEWDLLTELKRLLPAGRKVVILADRGFGKTELAKHCQALGLDYVIRIKPNVHIQCEQHAGLLSRYTVRIGQCHVLRDVAFRKHDPVVQQVAVKRSRRETFHLMTSLSASAVRLFGLYEKRMPIEETFRDQKSHRHGFSLRSTRVTDPAHFDRLLLVLAIAYLLLSGLGLKVKREYPPSHWSGNKRDNECSVLTIARRMLDVIQIPPEQAFREIQRALKNMAPKWG